MVAPWGGGWQSSVSLASGHIPPGCALSLYVSLVTYKDSALGLGPAWVTRVPCLETLSLIAPAKTFSDTVISGEFLSWLRRK